LIENERYVGFVKRMKKKLGLWNVQIKSILLAFTRVKNEENLYFVYILDGNPRTQSIGILECYFLGKFIF